MSSSDTGPAPDQAPGAPHPRETLRLLGQQQAEAAFHDALTAGRLHHAWLLTGPKGIGKATFAYGVARSLLAPARRTAPASVDPDHPVLRRIRAGAEPRLCTVTRSIAEKTGRLRDVIAVDDVRALHGFLGLTAADGGQRVVIVDAADEMNRAAANALLKMLEEPPRATTLLLIAHQPARLLPTIRSRCVQLRLAPLSPADMAAALQQAGAPELEAMQAQALAELSGGSVGAALRLLHQDGLSLYADLVDLLAGLPSFDRAKARALADSVAGPGKADRLRLLLDLLDMALARLARHGASGQAAPEAAPGEAQAFARLAPDAPAGRVWAETAARVTARARHGLAVNLDPASLVLDTVLSIAGDAQLSPT